MTHHGEATYTNLATGRKFTLAWTYIDQDKRVTYNRDGTLSILGNSPGSERVRGPDGKLLDVKAGLSGGCLFSTTGHANGPQRRHVRQYRVLERAERLYRILRRLPRVEGLGLLGQQNE